VEGIEVSGDVIGGVIGFVRQVNNLEHGRHDLRLWAAALRSWQCPPAVPA